MATLIQGYEMEDLAALGSQLAPLSRVLPKEWTFLLTLDTPTIALITVSEGSKYGAVGNGEFAIAQSPSQAAGC